MQSGEPAIFTVPQLLRGVGSGDHHQRAAGLPQFSRGRSEPVRGGHLPDAGSRSRTEMGRDGNLIHQDRS